MKDKILVVGGYGQVGKIAEQGVPLCNRNSEKKDEEHEGTECNRPQGCHRFLLAGSTMLIATY